MYAHYVEYPLLVGISGRLPVQSKVSEEAIHLGSVGKGSGAAGGQ